MSDTSFLVRRNCSQLSGSTGALESRPLEDYRDSPAYVLLGDPGAGKTTSLAREARESGGVYVKARDFATFDPDPNLSGKTLFIDALDEMRAGFGDGTTPLDHIRRHLVRLGRPRFRLSCREADWLGASDREALQRVAPSGELTVFHLDPLTDDDIARILENKKFAKSDAARFVRAAGIHGLSELLRNPQTLDLLVRAVGGKTWPQSREDTYKLACGQLVHERNKEHRLARGENTFPPDILLDAAGCLCAIQLLSGIAGFATDEDAAGAQHFYWVDVTAPRELPWLPALKSNLFRRDDREQQRIPIHRSVAEYLGARYLAALIDTHGVPLGRVLALLAGEDGGIVSDLRGLAAWLSVHCRRGRAELIERDPLGVVLYGDVRNFPAEHKRRVLAALRDEANRYPWFRSEDWTSAPFGALATPDMEPTFKEILTSDSRSDTNLALLDCVLDALRYSAPFPALDDTLETIARSASYRPDLRASALQILLRDLPRNAPRCVQCAKDVFSDAIEDRDDQLLGVLLSGLYPRYILPAQVLDYLRPLKRREDLTDYLHFWRYELPEATPDDALPLVLNQLSQKKSGLKQTVGTYPFVEMAGELLVRSLEAYGDSIDDGQLYSWLGVGLDEHEHSEIDGDHCKSIQRWLSERPERYKAMLLHGTSSCLAEEDVSDCWYKSVARLYGVQAPSDIGPWYLEQATKATQADTARHYFEQAVLQLIREGGQQDLTIAGIEFLESWTAMHPAFKAYMEPFVSCPINHWRKRNAERDRERKNSLRQRKQDWVRFFREHLADIRDGSAHPKILHDLAQAYLRGFYEVKGDTPHARLTDFLDGDRELVQAAYDGFRRSLARDDLPSVAEIVDLELKGHMHYLPKPCLVGMEEFYSADPDGALRQDDAILSRLLAFHLNYRTNKDRAWFDALVKARPTLVAEVLIAYAVPMLRKGKEPVAGLYLLAHDDASAELARTVLPRLLTGFPLRARTTQLVNSLGPLLYGALRYLERNFLASLLSAKLAQTSMDKAQRVYWLACGVMISPDVYEQGLARHVGSSKALRGHLGTFLYRQHNRQALETSLPESALSVLIELLAPNSPPDVYRVSSAMETADEVRSFISALASNPSEAAARELERLLGLPQLLDWHNRLRGALHAQRIARRKASFRHLDATEVCRTLANLQPANAADLAALVFDHLLDISKKIRDESTNDYRQYWSYDETNKKLARPKPENDCRDILLSDLNERLGRLGIDAQKEASYADDKRADIKVTFGGASGYNIPVEIKKDSHADLWRAMREQLIEKYVRDPATDGHGIYLVFWFGGKGMPPPYDGKKPRNAREVGIRLRQTLDEEERHRILVCVFDCALP